MDSLETPDSSPPDGRVRIELSSVHGARLTATRSPGRLGPVVLAHGFGQTRESWTGTQAKLMAGGFGSLSFDMRGHGRSSWNPPGQDYVAADFEADHVTVAAAAGHRPILVGASMGGLTALLAQARHDLYSALVLVDVTPRWERAGMERIQGFMRAHPGGFADAEHAAQAIADYLPHRSTRKTPAQLAAVLRDDGAGRLRWHWDPRLLEGFVANSASLLAPLEAATRALDVPVLLVSGGRSDLVSDATVAHFLDLAPGARHIRLPDATHMLAGDDNDAFADILLEFLRAHSSLATPSPAAAPDSGVAR